MKLAQQMVTMALYYHFDGWLVNIENHINVSVLEYLVVVEDLVFYKMAVCCSGIVHK